MLGEKSLAVRSSLFFRREVWKVLTTLSQLCASHIKRFRRSDKWGAVFRSIDDFPACFCMGRCLCLEPILPVATPVAALWRSTCKPYKQMKLSVKSVEKKKNWSHDCIMWSYYRTLTRSNWPLLSDRLGIFADERNTEIWESGAYTQHRLEILPKDPSIDDDVFSSLAQALSCSDPPRYLRCLSAAGPIQTVNGAVTLVADEEIEVSREQAFIYFFKCALVILSFRFIFSSHP